MKKITLQQLKDLDACKYQVELFSETFGDELMIKSEAHARKLAAKYTDFNYLWLSQNMLSHAALAEYKKACYPEWTEYMKVIVVAGADYVKVRNEARAEYWKVRNEAALVAYYNDEV